MNAWTVRKIAKKNFALKNPVLIGGLPGIGNVGKVAVDFIIDEIGAERVYDISSHYLPHSVFINEDNLIELPTISLYYKKIKGKDYLFLSGDAQPIDETSAYDFSEELLGMLEQHGTKELITLGGVGLPFVPKKPKIYCTGTSKDIIKKYSTVNGMKIDSELYGVVGPIVGVSGLLLGIAKKKNMNGVALLAETYANPLYLGIKGAREIVFILNKKLSLNINMKDLDEEIAELEEAETTHKPAKGNPLQKIQSKLGKDITYIG